MSTVGEFNMSTKALGVAEAVINWYTKAAPEKGTAHLLKSAALKNLGCIDRSIIELDKSLKVYDELKDEGAAKICLANMAASCLYGNVTHTQYTRLASEYSRRYVGSLLSPKQRPLGYSGSLNIGILSPDLCAHSLAQLLYNPFKSFSELSRHKLFAYYSRNHKDGFMEDAWKPLFKCWRDVAGKPTDDICKMIMDDRIDILIDITGYTAEGRLDVFCKKPAPVQVGLISGMMTPTELSTIEYFLTDSHMLYDGYKGKTKFISVPSILSYRAFNPVNLKEELPAVKNGFITFAALNNPCKLNAEVLSTWMAILQQVENSQLHLRVYDDSTLVTARHFALARNINPERIVPFMPVSNNRVVQEYYIDKCDIMLETWPCPGCLTTLESIACGVPALTLYKDSTISKQSASVLKHIGMDDWCVTSTQDYIAKAVTEAKNLDKLGNLRKTLPAKLLNEASYEPTYVASCLETGLMTCWADYMRKRGIDYVTSPHTMKNHAV
jgi:predicted O-linked N-acetylglucosamine transferase (SPINDLY family)